MFEHLTEKRKQVILRPQIEKPEQQDIGPNAANRQEKRPEGV
jgi:hypothetical protein